MKAAKDVVFGLVRGTADRLGSLRSLEADDRVAAVRLLARRHHDRPRRLEVCVVCLPHEGPLRHAWVAFDDADLHGPASAHFDALAAGRLGLAARSILASLDGVTDPAEFADRVMGGR